MQNPRQNLLNNHLDASLLANPEASGGNRVLFLSGDDEEAKGEIKSLIEKAGFFGVNLGALDVGGPLTLLPFGSLAGVGFVKA